MVGAQASFGLNGTEKTHAERSLRGFLFEDQKGDIWIVEPLISLGMIGVSANPPVYRLSSELAERYRPLAMQLDPKPEDGSRVSYWYWGYPRPADGHDPTILVNLDTTVRIVKGPPIGASTVMSHDRDHDGPSRIFEIISVDLKTVEFAPAEWREGWDRLNQLLKDIVAETLTAPGAEKKERLQALINEAAGALEKTRDPQVKEEWKELVHEIDLGAKLVTTDQEAKAREWGRVLRKCVERLGIEPAGGFPGGEGEERKEGDGEVLASVTYENCGLVVRPLNEEEKIDRMVLGGILIE
jgi:hypothetical protein